MMQAIKKGVYLAVSVGVGTAIYQYLFLTEEAFDVYRPVFISIFSFLLISLVIVIKKCINR